MDSRFKIIKEKFGHQTIVKLTDSTNNEFVTILPETGAMLLSYMLEFNGKLISVLDSYENESELSETLPSSFKGSNLFPFPNRIDGGKYKYKEQSYQLPVNFPAENNAIHGLLYDKKFKIIEELATDEKAIVIFQFESKGDLPGFPFKFNYKIKYELDALYGLTVKTSATNTDNKPFPVGFGFHPYFRLDGKVNELQIEFPADEYYLVNEKLIPTRETLPYELFKELSTISDSVLDSCFSISTKNQIAQIKLFSEKLNGGIDIWQETGENKLNYLQVYTPPHRNSIAIEPMTCIANAFNNKIGLIELQPNTTSSVLWGIRKIQ